MGAGAPPPVTLPLITHLTPTIITAALRPLGLVGGGLVHRGGGGLHPLALLVLGEVARILLPHGHAQAPLQLVRLQVVGSGHAPHLHAGVKLVLGRGLCKDLRVGDAALHPRIHGEDFVGVDVLDEHAVALERLLLDDVAQRGKDGADLVGGVGGALRNLARQLRRRDVAGVNNLSEDGMGARLGFIGGEVSHPVLDFAHDAKNLSYTLS